MDGKTHYYMSDLSHSNKDTTCYFRVITPCSLTATQQSEEYTAYISYPEYGVLRILKTHILIIVKTC